MAEEEEKKEDIPEEKSEEVVEEKEEEKTEEASEEKSKEEDKKEDSAEEDEDEEAEPEDKKEEEEKVENSKVEELKTLAQAQSLLSKAAEEIQGLKNDMKKLKSEVDNLKPKADKYAKLIEKQKLEAVDMLVKKKLSLGMIKKEDVDVQKEMLKSSKIKNIKLMTKELGELKPVIRKESLKGSENEVEEKTTTLKKLMEGAGFNEEFIKNYKNEE